MDADTSEAIREVHKRVDELVALVTRTAVSQENLTKDVDRLTRAIEKLVTSSHGTPCRDCRENAMAIKALSQKFDAEQKETIAIKREVKRDWRKWLMGLLKIVIVGVGAFVAGRATEIWHFVKGH